MPTVCADEEAAVSAYEERSQGGQESLTCPSSSLRDAAQGEAEEVELEEGGDLFDEEAPARKQKKKKGAKKRRTVEEEQEEEEELEPEEVAGLQVGALESL